MRTVKMFTNIRTRISRVLPQPFISTTKKKNFLVSFTLLRDILLCEETPSELVLNQRHRHKGKKSKEEEV